jgi:hypothetical protein
VATRELIELELTLDGQPVQSETRYTWAGAYVLSVHTVIPQAGLAVELHSTFVGHPGVDTHATHLLLGPAGSAPSIRCGAHEHEHLDPVFQPRACVYEHAQQLIEQLAEHGHRAGVTVPDESAFAALERVSDQ